MGRQQDRVGRKQGRRYRQSGTAMICDPGRAMPPDDSHPAAGAYA
jgi:hypothetical protein